MRSLLPRRQSTTLPVTFAGSSVPGKHSAVSVGSAPATPLLAASTTCVGVLRAPVTEAPVMSNGAPGDGVTCAVAANVRAGLSAATEVSHGTVVGVPTVLAPGPLLPAELATNTPASEAPRNAY